MLEGKDEEWGWGRGRGTRGRVGGTTERKRKGKRKKGRGRREGGLGTGEAERLSSLNTHPRPDLRPEGKRVTDWCSLVLFLSVWDSHPPDLSPTSLDPSSQLLGPTLPHLFLVNVRRSRALCWAHFIHYTPPSIRVLKPKTSVLSLSLPFPSERRDRAGTQL